LLNTVYKIGSGSIANRLKTHINKLINNDQTGFIKGRFIGENTRLIYDILKYTEENNIPGLFLLIDFERHSIPCHGGLLTKHSPYLILVLT